MKKTDFFPVIEGSFTPVEKSGMAFMIIPILFLKRLLGPPLSEYI